jgi:uncharacterized protein (DUF885 family)
VISAARERDFGNKRKGGAQMRMVKSAWLMAAMLVSMVPMLHGDQLDQLSQEFWTWRATEQPITGDDITRIERSESWVPDWSPQGVAAYRQRLDEFETRWKKIEATKWPVARQVDYRLMGSAIARVRWELEVNPTWRRDPGFYLEQTLGAYMSLLLPPPPFSAARTRQIVATLASIPRTIENGKKNLTEPAAPFAQLALDQEKDVRSQVLKSVRELKPKLDREASLGIDAAAEQAIVALESYRDWLHQRLPAMTTKTAIGRDAYMFFLQRVALLPYTPEQLLAMGTQEWARSVASQTYEEHRSAGTAPLALFKDQAEQAAREEKDDIAVREFLKEKEILTVPADLPRYRDVPTPSYLAPVADFGEIDDFTGPSRLKQSSTRYIDPPSDRLGYFAKTMASDPRPILVHEGIPGHYFQLALSWAHPDPMRRHYYDSGANEGLGFYAEEMMLHGGFFDDSPRTRVILWNFMRLRALRVEVDVKLALGQFTIEGAADYLRNTVPMDPETARGEASFFAATPGQGISYEIGKLQIFKFLADAKRQKGEAAFDLRAFHDFLWLNGNVPIVLQSWEYLGMKEEVEELQLH